MTQLTQLTQPGQTPPSQPMDIVPEDAYLDKYRLVSVLGRGGMGTVYLALASGLGTFRKLLVVKELRHDVPWKSESLAMFMDEAHLAARLEHPNVLQTFEAGEDRGRYFLAMEYLDGQPLNALIDRALASSDLRGLPLTLQLYILCEVLAGLHYAHELRDYDGSPLQVVHRDVSPHNVFVTYHGQIKIVDFGLAKATSTGNLTTPGIFKGKFAYAAPEQLLGHTVDRRCDVFSAGVMLWEAIAGRRFSDGVPSAASVRLRTSGGEPRIRQVVPGVDPALAEISDRALAVDQAHRYPSADALRRALEAYLHERGERVESAQIAAVMRELFAQERSERHRVIERTMTEVGATRSTIQALPIVQGNPLDRLSRTSVPPPAPPHRSARASRQSVMGMQPARPKPAGATSASGSRPVPVLKPAGLRWPRWLGVFCLVSLALLVFVVTFQFSRSFTSVSLPTLRPAPEPDAAAAPPPSLQPSAASVPQPTAADVDHAGATLPETESPRARQQGKASSSASGRNGRSRSGKRSHNTDTAQTTQTAANDEAEPSSEEPAHNERHKASTRQHSEPSAVGVDLRDLRHNASRPRIDTEDPYQ